MSVIKNSKIGNKAPPYGRRRLCRAACFAFYLGFTGFLPAFAGLPGSEAPAVKKPPKIAVSIKPLHSLVSAVAQNIAEPALIMQGSGSEHGYALRPQDAENLSTADIVFWAGPQMETFLQKPLQNLSPQAEIIALATAPGIELLPMRRGGVFVVPDSEKGHSYRERGEEQGADLHFWLDPQNAKAAVTYIDRILSQKDPARAALYHSNAENYRRRLDRLIGRVNEELAPVRGRPFIVFHDAYQYFERRFAMPAMGAITVNPEQAPGARRVAAMRARIVKFAGKAQAGFCIFSEPQFEPRLVRTISEGTKARTGVLDPLGSNLLPGPEQYPALIQNLADSLTQCLSGAARQVKAGLSP
ncbi:MAG: zinc ABC transporter substrate-binding protein [Candidatus Tokpelaia sp.]|nr:MAG: zinc ABC transporter substrate-binding protein [Candidatus Tokpelaia sp.]KAA6207143.1 MAG: zinc ABC transporter substrate-binding protein [Candidatus Tokpelaia sp.]